METNPYLAPEAVVVDAPASRIQQPPVFAVSTTKLVVMSLATMNLYSVYWFYKHWVAIRRRKRDKSSPFWRAIFSVLWAYSCFKEIEGEANRHEIRRPLSPGGLALGWFVVNLLSRLRDPFWLVSVFAFLFLLPVQSMANELNAKVAPEADRNSRFNWANITWIAIAGLMWLLVIIGTFLPEQPAA